MSNQSLRQASVRAVTGTTGTYEGDWHALFTSEGIAAGPYNQRLLAWINARLSASYTTLSGAKAAFAAAEGVGRFNEVGTFDASGSNTLTLAWDDDTTDPTPDFTLTGATDLQVADVIRLTIGVTNYDNTIDGSELAELSFAFATGALANGTYSARAYHRRGGTDIATSNSEPFTINDTTAPTLSSPTDTEATSTTADGTVSTNEANGRLYWVASTSASAPSAAQVKAGQMHTGAAAAASGSQSVTATGAQAVSITGLTASTTYYIHYMHEDIGPNQSTVASADGFTTSSSLYTGDDMPRPYFTAADAYETMLGTTGSNTAVSANRLYMLPIIPYQTRTYTTIVCRVTTAAAAGKFLQLGIFNADQTTAQPTTVLVDSGNIAADGATGMRSYTFSQSLTGGTLYYLAFQSDGAPSIMSLLASTFGGGLIYAAGGGGGGALTRQPGAYPAYSDQSAQTFSLSGDVNSNVPMVGIR